MIPKWILKIETSVPIYKGSPGKKSTYFRISEHDEESLRYHVIPQLQTQVEKSEKEKKRIIAYIRKLENETIKKIRRKNRLLTFQVHNKEKTVLSVKKKIKEVQKVNLEKLAAMPKKKGRYTTNKVKLNREAKELYEAKIKEVKGRINPVVGILSYTVLKQMEIIYQNVPNKYLLLMLIGYHEWFVKLDAMKWGFKRALFTRYIKKLIAEGWVYSFEKRSSTKLYEAYVLTEAGRKEFNNFEKKFNDLIPKLGAKQSNFEESWKNLTTVGVPRL